MSVTKVILFESYRPNTNTHTTDRLLYTTTKVADKIWTEVESDSSSLQNFVGLEYYIFCPSTRPFVHVADLPSQRALRLLGGPDLQAFRSR